MKIGAADPCGYADAAYVSDHCADQGKYRGFAGDETSNQAVRGANCFHNCEIPPPVEEPAGECCKNTKRGSRDDECGRPQQGGASLAQDIRLVFGDLADRMNVGSREFSLQR